MLPKTYNPNGYVDIIRPKHFMSNDNLHRDKMLAYVTPYAHEVDTLDDFKILLSSSLKSILDAITSL